jgi:hypothetical protein
MRAGSRDTNIGPPGRMTAVTRDTVVVDHLHRDAAATAERGDALSAKIESSAKIQRRAQPSAAGPQPASLIRIRYIMEYIYIQFDQIFSAKSCRGGSVLARFPTDFVTSLHGIFRLG